jgi:hypothetical protein
VPVSTPRVIARNIFSNWANLAVTIVIGFFMMPFLIINQGLGQNLACLVNRFTIFFLHGNLSCRLYPSNRLKERVANFEEICT